MTIYHYIPLYTTIPSYTTIYHHIAVTIYHYIPLYTNIYQSLYTIIYQSIGDWGEIIDAVDPQSGYHHIPLYTYIPVTIYHYLMIPGSICLAFGSPWDQFAWLLLPWRPAWKLMTFQGDFGVTPDLAPRQVDGKWCPSGTPLTIIPGSLNMIPEMLRPKLGNLTLRRGYIGYMIHWKLDYTWSVAAWWPPQGGPADLVFEVFQNDTNDMLVVSLGLKQE